MESKTTLGAGIRPLQGGGGIFKTAAVAILRMERRLMTTGEITKVALEKALINCQGRTPEATMASALYTDVKRKLNSSVFTRPQEGLFGLKEWEAEGFVPEPVYSISPSTGQPPLLIMPKRARASTSKASKRSTRQSQELPDNLSAPLVESSSLAVPAGSNCPLDYAPDSLDVATRLEKSRDNRIAPFQESASTLPRADCKHSPTEPLVFDIRVDCAPPAGYRPHGHLRGKQQLEGSSAVGSVDSPPESRRKRPRIGDDHQSPDNLEAQVSPEWPLELEPTQRDGHLISLQQSDQTSATTEVSQQAGAALSLSEPSPCGSSWSGQHPGLLMEPELSLSGLSELNTPQLMQLPLPEGDLSWSPLFGVDLESGLPPPLSAPPTAARAALRKHADDKPVQNGNSCGAGKDHSDPDPILRQARTGDHTSSQLSGASKDEQDIQIGRASDLGNEDEALQLATIEAEVLRQEAALGANHPMVGKYWLTLSRAYQQQNPVLYAEKAEYALVRAWKICSHCFRRYQAKSPCDIPFDFLLERIRMASHSGTNSMLETSI